MNRVTTDDAAGASLCSCSSPLALRNPEVASHIKQWGQYSCTCCGCAANSPFLQVCVCFACAPAHAKHTQTCTTTCGRHRRPACTRILPLQFEKSCYFLLSGLPAIRESSITWIHANT